MTTAPSPDSSSTGSSTESSTDLHAEIEVAATPAQTWALVSDVRRMPEWSPQVRRTFVPGGAVRLGSRMVNLNHRGWMHWPTQAKVVRFEPHREVAFRVVENRTVWSFTLEPLDGGTRTRIVHRRETPEGVSPLSLGLTKVAFGGVPAFTDELRAGMQRTLERMRDTLAS
ncbi:SRPBCC family protein [uncultured Nocardioides sp.]|uniref:SRPBCC family protein n=1 Tax=uncultured Nocardioides sp. TaxID=198441 RepID=UPI0030FBBD64